MSNDLETQQAASLPESLPRFNLQLSLPLERSASISPNAKTISFTDSNDSRLLQTVREKTLNQPRTHEPSAPKS
ncbi:MAG: hypothetical protein Q4D17_09890 [Planctomycetia bacterium]|nr:hypothetical protein [Planctomycetia bacterium]